MLTSFDDYFIHQTPHPVTTPSTSDRHAYDRYWFNGYTTDGNLFFGIGAARYPNLVVFKIVDLVLSTMVSNIVFMLLDECLLTLLTCQ